MGLGVGAALGQQMAGALGQSSLSAPQEDPYEKLEKLHSLLTKGVLTQEEFDRKKAEILKSIS
jgi:hypothetical protein